MKFREMFNSDGINGMVDALPWAGIAGIGGICASASVLGSTNNPVLAAGGAVALSLAGAWATASLVMNRMNPAKEVLHDLRDPRGYRQSNIPANLLPSVGFAIGALAPLAKVL